MGVARPPARRPTDGVEILKHRVWCRQLSAAAAAAAVCWCTTVCKHSVEAWRQWRRRCRII